MNKERKRIITELLEIIEELKTLEQFYYQLNDEELIRVAIEIMKLDIMKNMKSELHGIDNTLGYI